MRRVCLAVAVLLAMVGPVLAAPCTTTTADCVEWLTLGRGGARSLVYRTVPLGTRNDRMRRALVMVHDTTRDAPGYFQIALAAAARAGALDDTIVVAPRFAARNGECRDGLASGEVNWPCEGNSWRSGGVSSDSGLSSFELADEILHRLARKDVFPNLELIVVCGHSAGGQFVTRYEMTNRVHETLGVPVVYVVSNPSSYAYPEPLRPVRANGAPQFSPYPEAACPEYDEWPYGMARRGGYAARTVVAQLKKQLVGRPTTYLLGELDVEPNAAFDASCAAMAQGPTRLARGRAFAAYVNQRLGAHHALVVVPRCGHDPRCMFTADAARAVLFPAVHDP